MNKWFQLKNSIASSLKGITPKYVDDSSIVVLNQKCIRHNKINYSFSRFHDENKNFNESKILKVGDLLFNSTGQGTAGRCAFVRELPSNKKVITDSHILIVRINDYHLAECFSYALYREEQLIKSFMDGSTGQGELDKLRLFNMEFRLPEKKNRKYICELLNALDQKIELNNQINEELESLTKLIYDYWFVQFDFPDANGKPFKSSGGKMVYNEKLKREIPVGWNIIKLDQLAEIKRGKLVTAKTADLNGKYKVVSAGIDYSYMHSEYNREKNTITVSGSGANAGLINFWREQIFANDCTTVRGKTDEETLVILQFLKLRQAYILNQARGSAQPHVYPKDLESLKILIPNINLFKKYGKMALSFNEQITINEKENQKLTELCDWLLPMLMNGQVTVGEAKQKVEEALGMVAEDNIDYGEVKVTSFNELYPDPYNRKQRVARKHKLKRRQVLTTTRIIKLHKENGKELGHTKTEKINHAIEYIEQFDLGRDPVKNVGGPVDFYYVKAFVEPLAKKQKVFEAIENDGTYHYEIKDNFDTFLEVSYNDKELAPHSDKIDLVIKSFLNLSLRETELYMTVYAGWNNLLIRKEASSFENITKESLDVWKDKRSKFDDNDVEIAINWLKEMKYEPVGYGKEVR